MINQTLILFHAISLSPPVLIQDLWALMRCFLPVCLYGLWMLCCPGSKLLAFWIYRTPKNGDGNPNLGPGFPTGNPGIVSLMDNPKLGFSDRKSRNRQGNPNSEAGFPNRNPNFSHNF